ncbi:MAG: CDP-archaeol synthase [Gammaproteobacteria bacterium]|nr:MAG: CDP-archaeol synthase [Gammaproteobacteria bacterium]
MPFDPPPAPTLLLLAVVVNGAPVLARLLCGGRLARPLDLGLHLPDGHRLFGDSKTWRGLLAALLAGLSAAPLLGIDPATGVLFGLGAMLGDLASSFLKRRLGLPPSTQVLGLDQIPECALPLWLTRARTGLAPDQVWALVAAFVLVELLLSRLLFVAGIRRRPS